LSPNNDKAEASSVHVDAFGAAQLRRHLACDIGNGGFILTKNEEQPDIGSRGNGAYETAFLGVAHSPPA
jgi:hypothetical protein